VKPDFKKLGAKYGAGKKEVIESINANGELLIAAKRRGESECELAVAGKPLKLALEDVIFESTSPAGWYIAEDKLGWLALDLEINEELEIEGLMRDLLRKLQVQRKEEGLEIEDRINLVYDTQDQKLLEAAEKYTDYLKAELLCLEFRQGQVDKSTAIKIGDAEIQIAISKA
jgi:isoleucyl-tRNA synthetase